LRLSRPNEAARAARSSNLAGSLEQPTSRRRQTAADSTMALAWCKLAGAEDRVTEALAVARRWRAHVTTAGAAHAAAEWNIALAELLMLAGDRKAAQRTLTQAITHAAPARFVRIFLDEGEPVAALLEQMIRSDAKPQGAHDAFVRELLGARAPAATRPSGIPADAADAGVVSGRLNTRELEILVLAGSGMLNKQISEKLGLTEGTVKWYLQQVFDKLGVRDRARAAAKARQLGLIG
jgi:LuxR family maltose regulon positive regulatory protein